MSTEATIIAALKSELEGITKGNGYNTTVRMIKHQSGALSDVEERPALTFWVNRRARDNSSFGRSKGTLHFTIRGWIDHQKEDYDAPHDLLADVESLLTTWTYQEFSNITETIPYFDDRTRDMVAIFDVNFTVDYFYTEGSP